MNLTRVRSDEQNRPRFKKMILVLHDGKSTLGKWYQSVLWLCKDGHKVRDCLNIVSRLRDVKQDPPYAPNFGALNRNHFYVHKV